MIDEASGSHRKTLHGKRVFLRPMLLDDADYVVRWRNDPDILANLFVREPLTLESHLKWLQTPREDRLDYVICLRETNRPIGTVNFTNIDRENLKAEAGKMLGDKSTWGKGLAKEAFILWMEHGFNNLGLGRIYVKTFITNLANIGLNKKLGFKIEKELDYTDSDGKARKFYIMGLTKENARKTKLYNLDLTKDDRSNLY